MVEVYRMAVNIDPEGNEIRALERLVDWRAKNVLEIGCGEGRLTIRLAGLGANVHALDVDFERIDAARKNLPGPLVKRISCHVGEAEHLAIPGGKFDLAIFSWAL
jgi:2-polyprenyl-3-methyl-5-hydroxy-6-metoxy-1,4-benzoquinol methylase